eukprot:TRINITY_DN6747_c2_g1_i1.p2 TRINITY_DN6747_c2_g1~~TRINITY_DN6747_c2_g1_i1.p2  ORF type:complete len:111 (-),score=7.43 TRINITY_DN6747_c2_g1_i1:19-351(-)
MGLFPAKHFFLPNSQSPTMNDKRWMALKKIPLALHGEAALVQVGQDVRAAHSRGSALALSVPPCCDGGAAQLPPPNQSSGSLGARLCLAKGYDRSESESEAAVSTPGLTA